MPASKMKPVKVFLVDDHEVVRVGLKTLLTQHRDVSVVGEAASVADAVRGVSRRRPHVVLLDLRLPDGSGVEACRAIIDACPAVKVIFLTSFADEDSVLAAVVAGAQGYLLKEIDSTVLLHGIRTVAEGRSILDPTVTQRALAWIKGLRGSGLPPPTETLSAQEERVLALVAEGKTNKEIAADLGLSDKTVKNYLANVFQKLRITRRAQAAAFFVKRRL